MSLEVEDQEASQAVADTSPEPAAPETPSIAVEEVTETTPETVSETPAPEPTPFSLREFLKETGGVDLTAKYQSDEDAAKGIANALSLVGKKSEKERQFDALAPYLPQFQQFLASQQRPEEPQPKVEEAPFSPPKVRETDKRWVEVNPETGERQIKANAPLDVRQRLEAFVNYVDEYNYRLQNAPHELYQEFEQRAAQTAEEKAFQRMEAYLAQREKQQAEQQAISRIKSELADRFYHKNSSGQPLVDESGTPVLTPFGQAYVVREHELWQQYGNTLSVTDRHRFALEHAEYKSPPSKSPTIAPGATKTKNMTAGRVTSQERTAPKNTSLVEMIMAQNPDIDPRAPVDGLALSHT